VWYSNAVVYALDVAAFRDSDGDGWGDLAGVRERLDYLASLGVNCLWLQPFYRSPFRDGGYDVADYLDVDRRFGDLADFADLMEAADDRGIRVIVDLVVQHTSIDHPWFRSARSDPRSPHRDYYLWSDTPDAPAPASVFPGVEDGVWTYDEEAGQYYRHLFYAHQPDLNVANPAVREEIFRIMGFWLRLGVAGFRVDAAPYLAQLAAADDPAEDGRWFLRQLREFVRERRSDGLLLGETDVSPEEYAENFGRGDGMNLLFNFYGNCHLFLALARRSAEPLTRAIKEMPAPPPFCGYLNWLRNHDELDLSRLSEPERDEVMACFAPERSMRAYGRGIRRRPAPMLDGDERRLALAHSLVFGVPGTPMIRYGDEIGLGENLDLPEREAIRAAMQWLDGPNAGFSAAEPDELAVPVVADGQFAHDRVNVLEQTRRGGSLLTVVADLARTRRGLQEIGEGQCQVLDVGVDSVLALRHALAGSEVLVLANLADEPVEVTVPGAAGADYAEVMSDGGYPEPGGEPVTLTLNGYGYRWLRTRDTALSSPWARISSAAALPPRVLAEDRAADRS
jgi:maltose alpha-D-glucosyltransferase/alpha-amylase